MAVSTLLKLHDAARAGLGRCTREGGDSGSVGRHRQGRGHVGRRERVKQEAERPQKKEDGKRGALESDEGDLYECVIRGLGLDLRFQRRDGEKDAGCAPAGLPSGVRWRDQRDTIYVCIP